MADLIGADPKEIIFTSGATESNNLAIKGVANFYKDKKKHIITTQTDRDPPPLSLNLSIHEMTVFSRPGSGGPDYIRWESITQTSAKADLWWPEGFHTIVL